MSADQAKGKRAAINGREGRLSAHHANVGQKLLPMRQGPVPLGSQSPV